jgi:hypothetical protein
MRDADLWYDFAAWVREHSGRVGSLILLFGTHMHKHHRSFGVSSMLYVIFPSAQDNWLRGIATKLAILFTVSEKIKFHRSSSLPAGLKKLGSNES